jgi:hypothetical protein
MPSFAMPGCVRAAASARIADRFGGEQCRFVGLHRADVRFRRPGPHREAETGNHEWHGGAVHDLALLGELLDLLGIGRDQVRRTGVEPLIESWTARVRNGGTAGKTTILEDGHFVPARARKRIGEFDHPRSRALVGEDDEFSGPRCALQRRGQKSQNACCYEFSVPCHKSSAL